MSTTYLPRGDDPPRTRPDRRRRVLVLVAAAVVLAVGITWLVAFSPVLGVKSVEVRGERVLTEAQVRAAAHVAHGTPLVRLDTAAVARRVEALPDVDSVTVDTSYPSTVVITVHERQPVGYVRIGSRFGLVDHTGDRYREVPTLPADLPRFAIPSGSTQRPTGRAVAAVAAALPARIRAEVRSIEALDTTSITLVLTRNRVVRWGSADRNALKARLLPALLRKHSVTQVDLTDPEQPFTR